MNKQDILDALKSNNNDLDKVVEQYLVSFLDDPILGNNINNIEYHLEFGLNEYRINNFQQNGYDYERKTLKELRKEFNISATIYANFKRNLNGVLESYTDKSLSLHEQRDILEKQIRLFIKEEYIDSTKEKIHETLENQIKKRKKKNQEPKTKKDVYLDSILENMQNAKVNNIENNEYMVITSLFELYDEHTKYLEDFKQYKKDLITAIKKSSSKKLMDKEKCFDFIYNSFNNNCKEVIGFISLVDDMDGQEIHSICNNPNYNNSTSHQEIKTFCKKIQHKHNNSIYDTLSNYIHKVYIKCLQGMDTNNPRITDKLDAMTKDNYLQYLEEIDKIIVDTNDENLTYEYLETIKKKAFKAITWFVFYLLYGKNKFSTYAVHSILNEHSPIIRELYIKLFLKDRKTASNEDFEMKYNYNATLDNTIGYMEPYKYNSLYETILDKFLKEIEAKKNKK